jgi:hypothetical protein
VPQGVGLASIPSKPSELFELFKISSTGRATFGAYRVGFIAARCSVDSALRMGAFVRCWMVDGSRRLTPRLPVYQSTRAVVGNRSAGRPRGLPLHWLGQQPKSL